MSRPTLKLTKFIYHPTLGCEVWVVRSRELSVYKVAFC